MVGGKQFGGHSWRPWAVAWLVVLLPGGLRELGLEVD